MFQYEGHYEVDNDRATKGKERQVNEVHSYFGGINSKLFAPPGTYTKCLLLKPLNNSFYHSNKCNKNHDVFKIDAATPQLKHFFLLQ